MQESMSTHVKTVMVRVKMPEIKEMLVEENMNMFIILAASVVLVVLLVSIFIIISLKMRRRKASGYDVKEFDSETNPKLNQSGVEENYLKEGFLEVITDAVHNKSISSEGSTKYSDSVDDNISDTDHTDTMSDSSHSV